MPIPIQEDTIRVIWENNPDTPITASSLSKDLDYIASYRDFEFATVHEEGTILIKDPNPPAGDPDRLIMKREVLIGLINLELRIPINEQYKIFDNGLQDLYVSVNDMDNSSSNPQPNKTSWGANKEWFVFICDAENGVENYANTGQLLVSLSNVSPQETQVLGNSTYQYTDKDTRLIGGFKTDSSSNIIENSVWDISGAFKKVRAKKYYILDQYSADPEDSYSRTLYRPLRVSDLDSSTGTNNVFDNDVTIKGNLKVQTSGGADKFSFLPSTNEFIFNGIDIISSGSDISFNKSIKVVTSDTEISKLEAYGSNQGSGYVYVGQSSLYGGGLAYNGDNTPSMSTTVDKISFFRRDNGADTEVFNVSYDSNNVHFNGNIDNDGTLKISTAGTLEAGQTSPTGTSVLGYNGYLYATKIYNAVYNDLAEFFVVDDKKESNKVYYVAENGKLKITSKRAQKNVVGVYSDTPAFVMKEENKKKGVPIALSGSVKVFVKSKIKPGDELVSDKNGFATKANIFERLFKRSAIIGKALESSKDTNEKKILILV